MAPAEPITRKAAAAQLVKRNIRELAFHPRVSASQQGLLLDVYERLNYQGRFPTEAELAEISAIRAAVALFG